MSTNPLTIAAFADWIDKNRDPAREYDYDNWAICACGQYAQHLGVMNWYNNGSKFWWDANQLAYYTPHTFGALSKRLRERENAHA